MACCVGEMPLLAFCVVYSCKQWGFLHAMLCSCLFIVQLDTFSPFRSGGISFVSWGPLFLQVDLFLAAIDHTHLGDMAKSKHNT